MTSSIKTLANEWNSCVLNYKFPKPEKGCLSKTYGYTRGYESKIQASIIKNYVTANRGELTAIFDDGEISARALIKPELGKLLQELKQGDSVIISELLVLVRGVALAWPILEHMKKYNVNLVMLQNPYNLSYKYSPEHGHGCTTRYIRETGYDICDILDTGTYTMLVQESSFVNKYNYKQELIRKINEDLLIIDSVTKKHIIDLINSS